jgi:hypothetical protein
MGPIFIPSEKIHSELTFLLFDLDLTAIDYPWGSTFLIGERERRVAS